MLKTFFTLLATTARRERFLLRPFRSQGLAVDKLEDQLWEDRNILKLLFAQINPNSCHLKNTAVNWSS